MSAFPVKSLDRWWNVIRVSTDPERWNWSAHGSRGGESGSADSEAEARAKAGDAYRRLA